MYSDNETMTDLLGFEDQVADICDLVLDKNVLPVTVGLLGDWGSGKSSLLRMAESRLRNSGAVVAYFSPWRIEDYDDAKSALLDAVVHEVERHLPEPDESDSRREAMVEKLKSLRKRVRWLRAAGMAAKHVITVSIPTLGEFESLLRDEEAGEPTPSTARLARDFHEEFQDLVTDLGSEIVVLIDDLDRCTPEQVLDVLHAIRLFLCVPGTAFVIATDERVVRDAVRLRYPQAALASETDLPQEYLEKIVQVPVRIPPLGHADVESYLNLLVAEAHFDDGDLELLRAKAAELRTSGLARSALNLGIIRDTVEGNPPAAAEAEFELIGRIAGVLASGLKGNPRQIKRFLNALGLRRNAAARRGVITELNEAVLAKLMVLEYIDRRRFQELHEVQMDSDGLPAGLEGLESANAAAGDNAAIAAHSRLANWETSRWMQSWLKIEPPLTGVDLRPYFLLARESLHATSRSARRLPEELQKILEGLASPAAAQRSASAKLIETLDAASLALVMDAAIERLSDDPQGLGIELAGICEKQPSYAAPVLKAFEGVPFLSISIAVPAQLVGRLKAVAAADLIRVLELWESQNADAPLSRAASQQKRIVLGN